MAPDRELCDRLHAAYSRLAHVTEEIRSLEQDYRDAPSVHRAFDDARRRLLHALQDFISTSQEISRSIAGKTDAR